MAELGLGFDPWQSVLGRAILAKTADGLYAADTVVLSIARQVGKTYLVGLLVFVDSIINPGTTTVWTAHRFKVARETFNELRGLAELPALAPHIDSDAITTAAGNECIPFRNGSRIVFAARERGSVRGFTRVRRLVLDEAQILTESVLADLAPTQNQADNPQIVLMGTPPKPSDPGEVFTQLRAEALAGNGDGILYAEFSADDDSDLDDMAAWATANPSLGTRTPVKAIRRLRKLLSDDDFRREVLGIWAAAGTRTVLDLNAWSALAIDRGQPKATDVALAIDVTPDRSSASVAFAGLLPDGRRVVEVIDQAAGTAWIVHLVADLRTQRPGTPVMLDATGPAGSLIEELAGAEVTTDTGLIVATTRDMTQACGALFDAVAAGTVHHFDQPGLNSAVGAARKRPVGDAWAWHRKDATDISPLVSVTLALAALGRPAKKKPGKKAGSYW